MWIWGSFYSPWKSWNTQIENKIKYKNDPKVIPDKNKYTNVLEEESLNPHHIESQGSNTLLRKIKLKKNSIIIKYWEEQNLSKRVSKIKFTPKHSKVKLQNAQHKEKILEATKEKEQNNYKRIM